MQCRKHRKIWTFWQPRWRNSIDGEFETKNKSRKSLASIAKKQLNSGWGILKDKKIKMDMDKTEKNQEKFTAANLNIRS